MSLSEKLISDDDPIFLNYCCKDKLRKILDEVLKRAGVTERRVEGPIVMLDFKRDEVGIKLGIVSSAVAPLEMGTPCVLYIGSPVKIERTAEEKIAAALEFFRLRGPLEPGNGALYRMARFLGD